MSKICYILYGLLLIAVVGCQPFNDKSKEEGFMIQNGTLIFGDLKCGNLCEAIIDVTASYKDFPMSHIGMVVFSDTGLYAIEATGAGVQLTPLSDFFSKLHNKFYLANLKGADTNFIKRAVDFSKEQIGKPYNDEFVMNPDKYYCSQLIYDAFKFANNGKPIFQLQHMT